MMTPVADTGEFSIEEQLRRERSRTRERGVTDYQFVQADGSGPLVLLVPRGGALYARTGDGPLTKVTGSEGALDATLSPDGRQVAFVRDDELWVAALAGDAAPRQLTHGAGKGVTNGVAEYIAQEEMGRGKGFWWSPDSRQIAYVWADSSHIPIYPIVHQGTDTPVIEEHRYPFAGQPNARVRLGILSIDGDARDALARPRPGRRYLPGARRLATGRHADRANRVARSTDAAPRRVRRATAAATTLIEEHGEPWLNLADDLHFLPSGEFLWSHERQRLPAPRPLRRRWPRDPQPDRGRVGRDRRRGARCGAARSVYFHGTRDGVTERHLYRVSLDGGEIERVTVGAGWHETVVSPAAGLYVDRYGSCEGAPTLTIRRLDGNAAVATLFADEGATAAALGLPPPELTSFQTADGATLQAAIYAPPGAGQDERRYPLIVSVYGGPHAQRVANNWPLTVDLRAQYLAQQGYVVLMVDNRGSANRGLRFEGALAERYGADRGGRSGRGGPLAERAPVCRWRAGRHLRLELRRLHDLHGAAAGPRNLQGRRGGRAGHPLGWLRHPLHRALHGPPRAATPTATARVRRSTMSRRCSGKLLLIHGLIDENVHFRHTARLIAALTTAGKEYDLVLFPGERHMPRDAKGLEYQETRLVDYFRAHL